MKNQNILLVQPNFPIPPKSKNHSCFLPVGLLKLATYHKHLGNNVKLVKANDTIKVFEPDKIIVTSLFTYWSKYVRDAVQFYKERYPDARIIVGGIYASLMPEHCKEYTGCDQVFVGIHKGAEKAYLKYGASYDLVDVDYQIIHSTRGCIRRCKFCGTWKVEPKFEYKKSIKNEIKSNRLIFYDNNLFANPYLKNILDELSVLKHNGKVIVSESQCGFDGRLLTPEIAAMLKKAHFINPRIAWDWGYNQHREIKKQVDMLMDVGYPKKDIYVFMVYNWDIDYKEMIKKLKACKKWGVQIADCRFRPLDQTFDNYNSRVKSQTNKDYYIHPKWTDKKVRLFRRHVRQQNICIRMGFESYNRKG